MRLLFSYLIALGLLLIACGEPASQNASTDNEQPTAEAQAEAPAPKPAPQGIQPPYPIADSSQIQEVDGIQIYIVEKGSGAIPTPGSNVVINYHGYLTNGEVFDSSFEREGVADFPLNNLIQGWQIGLTKVPSGSKVKLIVPPELGYGSAARPGIPANSTLIFDIDLISYY